VSVPWRAPDAGSDSFVVVLELAELESRVS
jgi:hypothetical protein